MRSEMGGDGDSGGSGGDGGDGGGSGGDGGGETPTTIGGFLADNELSKEPSLANYLEGDVAGLAKGYVSAQKLIGADPNHVLKLPTGTGDEHKEAWGEVFNRLGRPAEADGYEMPKEIADKREDLQISDELVGNFNKIAHDLGLTPQQYAGVMQFYGGMAEAGIAGATEATEAAETARQEALDKFKTELGDQYEANLGLAKQGLNAMGDDSDEFKAMLDDTGLGDNPAVIKLFAKVGELLQEDTGSNDTTNSSKGFGGMTPDSAKAEITRLQSDASFTKMWLNEGEHGHADAVARMDRLMRMAYPGGT